jgi:hypothetical protein
MGALYNAPGLNEERALTRAGDFPRIAFAPAAKPEAKSTCLTPLFLRGPGLYL